MVVVGHALLLARNGRRNAFLLLILYCGAFWLDEEITQFISFILLELMLLFSSAHTVDDTLVPLKPYEQQIRQHLLQGDPSQLHRVDTLLIKYKNREAELLKRIQAKYPINVESPLQPAPRPFSNSQSFNGSQKSESHQSGSEKVFIGVSNNTDQCYDRIPASSSSRKTASIRFLDDQAEVPQQYPFSTTSTTTTTTVPAFDHRTYQLNAHCRAGPFGGSRLSPSTLFSSTSPMYEPGYTSSSFRSGAPRAAAHTPLAAIPNRMEPSDAASSMDRPSSIGLHARHPTAPSTVCVGRDLLEEARQAAKIEQERRIEEFRRRHQHR